MFDKQDVEYRITEWILHDRSIFDSLFNWINAFEGDIVSAKEPKLMDVSNPTYINDAKRYVKYTILIISKCSFLLWSWKLHLELIDGLKNEYNCYVIYPKCLW